MPAEPDPETGRPSDRPTAAPFMIALVIIVLVVIGIWLVNVLEGDQPTPEQLIGRAAAAQNDALQRGSYQDYQAYTCRAEHATEADVLERQRNSSAEQGARFIDGVSDVAVEGDRATATVTYHFDRSEDDKFGVPTTFVMEDGAWKVCSTASG
ncbi:lumazine-binding protein [Mycobacterium sp. IS-1496]|uniref:Rv0361 family membrane protein n=1 Tax=Mycobacterium sp. IS-1496 TaxID=1772284 RepID=UPI0007416C8D|nr:lumazine-binding protein [Mycobacterium sp. IS-1496]KUI32344.1 lumazine-binding protein [Mycobacterium sp. IS-1496]